MKKSLFSLLSVSIITVSSLSGTYAYAETNDTRGTVTITVINEETNELFSENRNNFSVNGGSSGLNGNGGGAIYLDGWNTAESNPHTISDINKDFKYSIQYTHLDYNGYSYFIDAEKSDISFDFTDSSHKELKVYMKKNYWGEPVEYSFDELLTMSEEEFASCCKKNEFNYVPSDLIESDIKQGAMHFIRMNPERFAADTVSDTIVSESISDINKNNADEYDFAEMISELNLPKEYYDVEIDENPFMIYSDSILSDDGEMKSYFFKLANIKTEIKPEFKNSENAARLYQLMRILPEKCDDFHSISIQYTGCADNSCMRGDINSDGVFNISDIVTFQKWLLGNSDIKLKDWKAADLCEDDVLNILDFCMMKKELIQQTSPASISYSFNTYTELSEAISKPDYFANTEMGNNENLFHKTVSAFENNEFDLYIPVANGTVLPLRNSDSTSNVTLMTSELYNLPWIWYRCNVNDSDIDIKLAYPSVVESDKLNSAKTYYEVLKMIAPNAPNPDNYTEFESYQSIYETEIKLANDKHVTAMISEVKDSSKAYVMFIYDGVLVSIYTDKNNMSEEFWNSFSLTEY